MTYPVDHYDVESMIRDAEVRIRSEFERELRALREELGSERVARQDAIESLTRVLNSRTDQFV